MGPTNGRTQASGRTQPVVHGERCTVRVPARSAAGAPRRPRRAPPAGALSPAGSAWAGRTPRGHTHRAGGGTGRAPRVAAAGPGESPPPFGGKSSPAAARAWVCRKGQNCESEGGGSYPCQKLALEENFPKETRKLTASVWRFSHFQNVFPSASQDVSSLRINGNQHQVRNDYPGRTRIRVWDSTCSEV